LGSNRNYGVQNQLQRFNCLCGKIKRTLLNKPQQEILLKFYKALAVPAPLYESECLTFTKQQLQQMESSEMRQAKEEYIKRKIRVLGNTEKYSIYERK
jgi:hypothetical protein